MLCSAPNTTRAAKRPLDPAPDTPEEQGKAPPDPLIAAANNNNNSPEILTSTKSSTLFSGDLKLRSSWGTYRKRHFVLMRPAAVGGDPELRQYKDSTKHRFISSVRVRDCDLVSRFGDFVISFKDEHDDERDLELRAKDLEEAEEWINCIGDAINEADAAAADAQRKPHAQKIANAISAASGAPTITETQENALYETMKEGFLQMPSASRFTKWQSRYFRLRAGALFYYRTDVAAEDDFEGEILIDGAGLEKSGEKTFLVSTDVRTVELLAPSPDAANDWMQAICTAQENRGTSMVGSSRPGTAGQLASEAKIPAWIERWDRYTYEENVLAVNYTLDKYFGNTAGHPDIAKVLNAVTLVIQDLDDKARECLPLNGHPSGFTEAGREPRPDIFEMILRFYHLRIVKELSAFTSDQSYSALSVKDLLRFMDLITAYDAKLNEILQGPLGESMRENAILNDLPEDANNMAEVYLRKLRLQLKEWTENIEYDNIKGGASRVETRIDGRLQTPGPTDLFNFLNEALALAKVSGVGKLQASVVSMCAVSLSDYLFTITNDLESDASKSQSCRYVCAVTNDCWTVLDHLDRLEQEQSAVLSEFSVDLEAVREKCRTHSTRTLEVLAAQVRYDVTPVLLKAFTKSHLESTVDTDDVIAVVVATFDDYLEDFQTTLEPPFLNRVAKMMTRDICGLYLARLYQAYKNEGLLSMSHREAELVGLDRKRLINCLESKFMHIEARKLFGKELLALDDIVDMLLSTPALIPDRALNAALREPRLRLHVVNAAQMCVDLGCNADGSRSNDKLARDLKSMVYSNIDEKVPGSREVDAVGWLVLERNPYVIMFGTQMKSPNQPTAIQLEKARDHQRKRLEEERAQFEQRAAPVAQPQVGDREAKLRSMQSRQLSTQWQPPTKRGQSAAELPPPSSTSTTTSVSVSGQNGIGNMMAAAAVTGAVVGEASAKPANLPYPSPSYSAQAVAPTSTATTTPIAIGGGVAAAGVGASTKGVSAPAAKVSTGPPGTDEFEPGIKLVYKNPNNKRAVPEECICALRRISDNKTDLAFYRLSNTVDKKTQSNVAFRTPVSYLRRVEYWDGAKPCHFGLDSVVIEDSPVDPLRSAKYNVEFCIMEKNGEKLHFTASTPEAANEWINALKASFMAAYLKWGSNFVEEESYYLGMTVKELRNVAKQSRVDLSGCLEKADMARALYKAKKAELEKNNARQEASTPSSTTPPVSDGPAVNPFAGGSDQPATNPFAKVDQKSSFAAAIDGKASSATPVAATTTATGAAAVPVALPVAGNGIAVATTSSTKPSASSLQPPQSKGSNASPSPSMPALVPNAAPSTASVVPPVTTALRPSPTAAAPTPTLEQDEQSLIELYSQIFRGLALLDEGSADEASKVFTLAVARAKELKNVALEAKAQMGLASAYRDQPRMRKAAAPLFEVAAYLFGKINETSDRLNALSEASAVYASLGQNDKAILVLYRYDDRYRYLGQAPAFEAQIARLKKGG